MEGSVQSWRVAFACSLIYMLQYGVNRLSGVLFVASMSRYGVGREAASFPYTFTNVVMSVTGPVAGILGQVIGVRSVIIFGILISAVGVSACYFAESVAIVTLLWGILYGIGMSCTVNLLPVVINRHFDRKRATASGVSLSGVCVGSFVIPPLAQIMIDNFGLSNTFPAISGLLLSGILAALLLGKLSAETQASSERDKLSLGKPTMYDAVFRCTSEGSCDSNENTKLNSEKSSCDEIYIHDGKEKPFCCCRSTLDEQLYLTQSPQKPHPLPNKTAYFERVKDNSKRINRHSDVRVTLLVRSTRSSMTSSTKEVVRKKTFTQHLSIMVNPIFVITVFTVSSYLFMMVCLLTIVVDFAIDLGVDSVNQKYVLMSVSGGELVGRLSLGWITDGHFMSRTRFMAFSFVSQGLAAMGIGLATGFPMLMVMLALHGLLHSGVPIVYPLCVADLIEKDWQIFTITSSGFLAGPLSLCISPLIGYFREYLGSYTYIFYGMSLISAMCGFLWILVPLQEKL